MHSARVTIRHDRTISESDVDTLVGRLGYPLSSSTDADTRTVAVALAAGMVPSRPVDRFLITGGDIVIEATGVLDRDAFVHMRMRAGVPPLAADVEFDNVTGPMRALVDTWIDEREARLFVPRPSPVDQIRTIAAEWLKADVDDGLFDVVALRLGSHSAALELVDQLEDVGLLGVSAWADDIRAGADEYRLTLPANAATLVAVQSAGTRDAARFALAGHSLDHHSFNALAERAAALPCAATAAPAAQPVQVFQDSEAGYHPDLVRKWSVAAPDYAGMVGIATSCTGLVRDVVQYVQWAGEVESPLVALGVALPVLGNLFGRVWYSRFGRKQTFSNCYTISLARSGGGKTSTRNELIALVEDAELEAGLVVWPDDGTEPRTSYASSIFTGGFTSDSALLRTLGSRPNMLALMDEAVYFVEQVFDARANQYAKDLAKVLLDAMTATPGKLSPQERASKDLTGKTVLNPCLSFAGMSTPRKFWSAFPRSAFDDGLVGRLGFFIDDRPPSPDRYRPNASPAQIEALRRSLVTRFAAIMRWRADHLGTLTFGHTESCNVPLNDAFVEVPYTPEALAVREQIAGHCRHMNYEAEVSGRIDADLWERAAEMIQRYALIHALGRDHERPMVTVEDLNFAGLVVIGNAGRLTRHMMGEDTRAIDDKASQIRSTLVARAEQAWSRGESIQHAKLIRRITADPALVKRVVDGLIAEGFMITKTGLRGVSYGRGDG